MIGVVLVVKKLSDREQQRDGGKGNGFFIHSIIILSNPFDPISNRKIKQNKQLFASSETYLIGYKLNPKKTCNFLLINESKLLFAFNLC